MQHRDVEAALVAHQQRPVIGNEFGEQADDEQHEKDPQGPEAAPVGAEIVEPAPGQRGDAPAEEHIARRRQNLPGNAGRGDDADRVLPLRRGRCADLIGGWQVVHQPSPAPRKKVASRRRRRAG